MRLEWTGREWVVVTDACDPTRTAVVLLDQAVADSGVDAEAVIEAIVEQRTAILH